MNLTSPISLRKLTVFGCLAVVAVTVSACGGSSGSSSSSDTEATTTAPPTTEAATTAATTGGGAISLAAGKKVFVNSCGGCHTLAAANTGGQVGPNLDDLKPSMAVVVKQVENGGGGMPSFSSQLSDAQIQAVAKYVSTEAGKGGSDSDGLPSGGAP